MCKLYRWEDGMLVQVDIGLIEYQREYALMGYVTSPLYVSLDKDMQEE